ncbi:hypothetical protein COX86_02770 [Candidatus Micrarchaeota archaeon CG_4_10_14_0_2_um_filter_60_11]|nr:MAG: hypothetical protein COU39_00935 [Candidatus Micrarchaeota archaeon CG10_big_fil_rev_8_21_14_0_10_60_32]PIO01826.1 MAG: hypothetical protein COT58_03090 [Candidatus Micrarchaeota archaeon CG09_land_8_20_14_0_10_60_16]PIY91907.1 MAG: hypothetical protein COY71_00665 [Candidatus Micrarchaeota archaeon CG_4_10_14_0_8_um_filter_60_7]PIZ90835.1 MAG: hypothetical protein COX86_02770 [Candidatus Micrarchaeota archaeon CG_4_10_14_0_2_um_filter_60_11]
MQMSKIIVIRVRGINGVKRDARMGMLQLGLNRKHSCAILDSKDAGMLERVKDYVTWGEADEDSMKLIKSKHMRLHPPVKGWKASIKRGGKGGALGKRADLKELLKRMTC